MKQRLQITLSPPAIERLDNYAKRRYGGIRSTAIEALILENALPDYLLLAREVCRDRIAKRKAGERDPLTGTYS